MISNKSYYGITALVYLALNGRGRHVGIGEIASSRNIPLRFLELIFSRLRAANIVSSVRGAGGGYLLSRTPDQITLAEVIFASEGMSEFVVPPTLLERVSRDDPLGRVLVKIMNSQLANLKESLKAITLSDIIQASGLSSEMYWI